MKERGICVRHEGASDRFFGSRELARSLGSRALETNRFGRKRCMLPFRLGTRPPDAPCKPTAQAARQLATSMRVAQAAEAPEARAASLRRMQSWAPTLSWCFSNLKAAESTAVRLTFSFWFSAL